MAAQCRARSSPVAVLPPCELLLVRLTPGRRHAIPVFSLSAEQMKRRKGSESSTIRTRLDVVSKQPPWYSKFDLNNSICRLFSESSCVAFQVIAHAQNPQPRTNVQTHECLSTERKDDQILRTETTTGGETGGEWISTADVLTGALRAAWKLRVEKNTRTTKKRAPPPRLNLRKCLGRNRKFSNPSRRTRNRGLRPNTPRFQSPEGNLE